MGGVRRPADPTTWFLSREERDNRATRLDEAHPGAAWSIHNAAVPLIHGARYFAELCRRLDRVGAGDLVLFTDWQSNPDQLLSDEPGADLVEVLGRAMDRGADVRALVWRSHADAIGYSNEEHQTLGDRLQARGADVRLDMRVRPNGAHHQKFVVIRHPGDPEADVAFVGGIDLCHGRRDDALHHGDPQADALAAEYGVRPPWHDIQVQLQGQVVHDVETVFRERWEDTSPTTRNPVRRWQDSRRDLDEQRRPLPEQAPPPPTAGEHAVQLLRTYPKLGVGWSFDFAPQGERSVARGYTKALDRARQLIYVEDQFMWGRAMSQVLIEALRRHPTLHLMAVLPQFPDQDGWFARDPQLLGRMRAVSRVQQAAPDRVAFYGLENRLGTPVYVHAKACVLDDEWASIGSDNFCRRSWTNDSELSAAVLDLGSGPGLGYATRLRLSLAAEHLDRLSAEELRHVDEVSDEALVAALSDCVEPSQMFARFAESADALDRWHEGGRQGPRPPGRLRRLPDPHLPLFRQALAAPWYRYLHDPDGRPYRLRCRGRF